MPIAIVLQYYINYGFSLSFITNSFFSYQQLLAARNLSEFLDVCF